MATQLTTPYEQALATNEERRYLAEIQRERVRDAQEEKMRHLRKQENNIAGIRKPNPLPITTLEIGIWLFPAITLDALEWFGQLMAVIPLVGWGLAGASSIVGAVMSGMMVLIVGLWLLWKEVTPFSRPGQKIFLVLMGAAFGNAVINWLPMWFGFFMFLFFLKYKRKMLYEGSSA